MLPDSTDPDMPAGEVPGTQPRRAPGSAGESRVCTPRTLVEWFGRCSPEDEPTAGLRIVRAPGRGTHASPRADTPQ